MKDVVNELRAEIQGGADVPEVVAQVAQLNAHLAGLQAIVDRLTPWELDTALGVSKGCAAVADLREWAGRLDRLICPYRLPAKPQSRYSREECRAIAFAWNASGRAARDARDAKG